MKSIEIGCRPNRRKVLTAALSIGVASMLPGFALAASDGDPAALAFDGDTILLARGGLFVSDDDGRTWTAAETPGNVLSLATHRDRPGRVVAGLAVGGVSTSEDGGASWRVSDAGLPDGEINAVAIASRNSDMIYASVRGDGLWKSEDAGATWSLAMDRPWLDDAEREPLALASVELETGMGGIWIYAGTEVGLARVPDCFCRWQDVQPGNAMDALVAGEAPPSEAPLPGGQPILSLASAPSAPEVMYAALRSGLWASQDGGVIWQKRASKAATAVAVHPRDETYIAALLGGILKISRDGGATWIETGEQ